MSGLSLSSDLNQQNISDADDSASDTDSDRVLQQSRSTYGKSLWDEDDEEEDEEKDSENLSAEQSILKACEKNNIERVTQLLLEDPLLVHTKDSDGYTPLHRACYSNHAALVLKLIAAGADIEARTNEGWTPLHSASRWNACDCIHLLLVHSARINAKTNGGLTPLMCAASVKDSRLATFQLLSWSGVDTHALNHAKDSAYDIGKRIFAVENLFELSANYLSDL